MKPKKLAQVGTHAVKVFNLTDTPEQIDSLLVGDWLHLEYLHEDGMGGSVYWLGLAGKSMRITIGKSGVAEISQGGKDVTDQREAEVDEIQRRGMLTPRIKAKSKEMLGYEITQTELRLAPYLLHCLGEYGRVDPNKVNGEERGCLSKWQKMGFLKSPSSHMTVTREFYDFLTEMYLLGYVDIDEVKS